MILPSDTLEVEVVEVESGFRALQDAWNGLVNRIGGSPFNFWEWSWCWWQTYAAPGDRLWIVVARKHERVVGLAPFYVKAATPGRFACKELTLIGLGEPEADEVYSEYLDIYVEADFKAAFLTILCRWIIGLDWGKASLRNLREGARVLALLDELSGLGCLLHRSVGSSQYCLDLPSSMKAYEDHLPSGLVKKVETSRRKLGRRGSVAWVEAGNWVDGEEVMHRMTQLHRARWQDKGETGVFDSARFCDFHRQLLQWWLPIGKVRIRFLQVDGTDIGFIYCLQGNNRLYYYQSGYQIEGFRSISLGSIILMDSIGVAIKEQLAAFDLLLGPIPCYKQAFMIQEQPKAVDIVMFNRTLYGYLWSSCHWLRGRIGGLLRP